MLSDNLKLLLPKFSGLDYNQYLSEKDDNKVRHSPSINKTLDFTSSALEKRKQLITWNNATFVIILTERRLKTGFICIIYRLLTLRSNMCRKRILCLFDVDGTLTKPRNNIEAHLEEFIYNKVKPICTLGLVGGSDFKKISEQMNGNDVIRKFDYVFPENGLIQYKDGNLVGQESIQRYVGEEKLQKFTNFCLGYLSKIVLPVKRGTFIEFRAGMLNVSPVGRSCSQSERDEFEKYDKVHSVRKNMIEAIKAEFPNIGLTYSIGGQISFDVFPNGWDKTYCLQHLENDGFEQIHFFGDKTDLGGNDYEIFHDTRTIGHKVMNPDDTKLQLIELLGI